VTYRGYAVPMSTPSHIAIIGAGPAALIAAEIMADAGQRVTIYDRMPSPGRKLLIAGRGGLNITHSEPLEKFLTRYGSAMDWLAPSIGAFPPDALRNWAENLGQETFVGSSGRIFPKSMKAVQLLRAWLQRLDKLGVQYQPRHRWTGWNGNALQFTTPQGDTTVSADATLLALGGASWPRLGSDGSWADILTAQGVSLAPLRPANMGFLVNWSPYMEKFAGEPLKPIAVTHDGLTQQGEAMITATGIEGGVIYALSARLREAIVQHGSTTITLDLRPGMTVEALSKKLQDAPRASKSLSTYLKRHGFSSLAINLLRETTTPEQLNVMHPAALAARFKALPLTLTGTAGIARAISTAGGITQDAVDAHFMLKAKPGIFAAGEMLDWEAPTGGYLLQACFSTGVAAAHGMLAYLQKPKEKPAPKAAKKPAATEQLNLF
jgi:uncharacterized flavoprotein (TIGR03862 family)